MSARKPRLRPLRDLVNSALQSRATDEHLRAPSTWRKSIATLAAFRRGDLKPAEGETRLELEGRVRTLADSVSAQRRRWREGDRVAAALALVEGSAWRHQEPELTEDVDGQVTMKTRTALESVQLGGRTLQLDGRAIRTDWRVQPEVDAGKIASCSRTWLVGRRTSGALAEFPLRCDRCLCPDCADHRAMARRDGMGDAACIMVDAGCGNALVTLTQDARPGPGPIVLTDEERLKWPELADLHPIAGIGETGTATGGESLIAAVDRLLHALHLVSGHSRRTRTWWKQRVLGAVWGVETTQRAQDANGRLHGPLRNHAHVHGNLTLTPGTDVKAFQERLLREWKHAAKVAGSIVSDRAQDVQDLSQVSAEADPKKAVAAIHKAVRQAIKYPGKIATMTTAGLVEFVAALKGRKLQRRQGCYDSATRVGALGRHLAVLQIESEGKACDVTSEDSAKAVRRFKLNPDADAANATLVHELGPWVAPALVSAWRELLGESAAVDPEDVADPMDGVLVTPDAHDVPQLVTRSRLRMWASKGRTLLVGLAPVGTATEAMARQVVVDEWVRHDAAAMAARLNGDEAGTGPPDG